MMINENSNSKKGKNSEWIIDNIAEASRNARAIYLLFIGFLAYCALTVVITKDRQLILNDSVHLPIVNLDVPLNGFFLLAPVMAIIVFIYLQLYLQRLKGLKTDLHTNYPSVEKRRLYPWLINIAEDPEPGIIGRLQKIIVKFSLWWLLPIVLILFSLGFLRKHEPLLSYVVGLIPVFGTAIVIWFWWQYNRVKSKSFLHRNSGKISLSIMVLSFGVYYIFYMIPWAFDGDKKGFLRPFLYVDLSYQMLINEPNKDYKTLYWENLAGTHLEGANFIGSILKRVDLENSNLNKANFYNANLEGARLNNAKLQGANLLKAQLQGADLRNAQLQGANLFKAQLQGANLRKAQLQGADISEAQLDSAYLFEAQLDSVTLWGAQLQGADLRNAQLQGADLFGAQLQNANIIGANFRGAQLQGVKYLTIEQLSKVKTLYMATLDSALMEGIKRDYPHLLERPVNN